MKTREFQSSRRGSVLIIVLWIAFGLVALTLYFAHDMTMSLNAADNRVAGLQAEQAIEGAARYVSNVVCLALTNGIILPGTLPDSFTLPCAGIPIGDATVWLIGRDTNYSLSGPLTPTFGLVDEASKLNLNTVSAETLQWLPRMTPDLAGAIVDWRDSDSDVGQNGGAEDETYARLPIPYLCKNEAFESVDELRLVYGMSLDLLYGEDANLNGVLDPNEDDADVSLPIDNRDGRLDPGLFDYLTVYTKEPTTTTNGDARINVGSIDGNQLSNLLYQASFPDDRIQQIVASVAAPGGGGPGGGGPGGGGGGAGAGTASYDSVLAFYVALANGPAAVTPDEFALFEGGLMNSNTVGLVNVNTASEPVLEALLAGLDLDPQIAQTLVVYRQANTTQWPTVAWVAEALSGDTQTIDALGPYITGRSYQFSADIVALGHFERGYRRVRFVFDVSDGTPRIIAREDLTSLGWALGTQVRQSIRLAQQTQ